MYCFPALPSSAIGALLAGYETVVDMVFHACGGVGGACVFEWGWSSGSAASLVRNALWEGGRGALAFVFGAAFRHDILLSVLLVLRCVADPAMAMVGEMRIACGCTERLYL